MMNNNIGSKTNNSHKNSSPKGKQNMTSSAYQSHAKYSLVSDENERESIRNRVALNPKIFSASTYSNNLSGSKKNINK
jgi:hypothetical protein